MNDMQHIFATAVFFSAKIHSTFFAPFVRRS